MNYYDLCCRYKGRYVTITDKRGKVHKGHIVNVTRTHVYLAPQANRNLGGFGYGWGWGYGYGAAAAVPLAFIGGLALGAAFWI
ncbi:hypothetical protein [Litchfieldia alkalitelluris]|uniref:hypothetical protein n=1 Tax=Litchfieldia alkalitelluris TaxID=304268 RepID=UPI00195656ED|nr:hypothetical protein [Litchfieldia alkalitelluris]